MKKEDICKRQLKLLEELTKSAELTTQDICEKLGVSEKVVWMDVGELNERGLVEKVRGGVRSKMVEADSSSFSKRFGQNYERKGAICRCAIKKYLRDDHGEIKRTIFLDSGTTNEILFKEIGKDKSLRDFELKVVSNNGVLVRHCCPENITLILAGGEYSYDDKTLIGMKAAAFFDGYTAKYAFLSASNVSFESGFLGYNSSECEVKKAMILNAEQVVILADESKLKVTGGELISRFKWSEKREDKKRLRIVVKSADGKETEKPITIVTNETDDDRKEEILESFVDKEKGAMRSEVEKYILFAP